MRALRSLLLGILLPSSFVNSFQYVVHEDWHFAADEGWRTVSRLDPDLMLPVRIALTQQSLNVAESMLISVSDPKSPSYGRYWSADEVARNFAPTREAVRKVFSWLKEMGFPQKSLSRSPDGGWIAFNATVAQLEYLLKAKYQIYEKAGQADRKVLSEEYSLPEEIRPYVDFVTPTIYFDELLMDYLQKLDHIKRQLSDPEHLIPNRNISEDQVYIPVIKSIETTLDTVNPTRCDQSTTLDCLRALYNIPTDNITHPNCTLGVVQFGSLAYRQADLDLFFHAYQPESIGRAPKVENVNGAVVQQVNSSIDFNGEANLDLEYTMGLTYPMTVINYQLNRSMNEMLSAFDKLYCPYLSNTYDGVDPNAGKPFDCGNRDPAKVISVSYAADEVDYPILYQIRQCTEFLKLGLQGITIVAASNDYGVAGKFNQCLSPTNGRPNVSDSGNFSPTAPSNCPFITSVGGTQLPENGTPLTREVAFLMPYNYTTLSSGGGFSNLFQASEYQASSVQGYMAKQQSYLSTFSRQFNSSGLSRGIPDVSLNAASYLTAVVNKFYKSSGTSASAPAFAAMIARINDARLKAGKTTVGFVNPSLYANQWVFNDITQGSNIGCGREGFRATEGWDPVTGLGTPDYVRLHELFMGLP